jgi:hypothetical protein
MVVRCGGHVRGYAEHDKGPGVLCMTCISVHRVIKAVGTRCGGHRRGNVSETRPQLQLPLFMVTLGDVALGCSQVEASKPRTIKEHL